MSDDHFWESYRLLVADINRYRSLPIQVFTFTSALHFAIIAAIAVKDAKIATDASVWLTVLLGTLWVFMLYFFGKCHLEYLKLRNVQVRLNRLLGLNTAIDPETKSQVFPSQWFKERPVALCEGWWGWGFYASYATVLFAVSMMVIWHCGVKWR